MDSAREREREIMKIVSSKIFVWLPVFGLVAFSLASTVQAEGFKVVPSVFDPGKSLLVSAEWERGVGCPTGAFVATYNPLPPPVFTPTPYTDSACLTGDPKDKRVEGLVLVKTGPTSNFAAAGAELKGVKGTVLTELGYDIRKIGPLASDDRGSHCGAGAPRFNVVIGGTEYFVGCNSPPATQTTAGTGWLRLLWGGAGNIPAYYSGTGPNPGCALCNIHASVVESISIVFDEGQDTGPDQFGLAVLDNIDVNGRLVGRGSSDDDKDKDRDRDKDSR